MEFSLRLTFLVRYVHAHVRARARACVCVCVVSHVWLFETLWTVPLRNEDEDETVASPTSAADTQAHVIPTSEGLRPLV